MNDRKTAVYCGTRNLYKFMSGAAKSLVRNSSVDDIYFLIEDNKFPHYIPSYVHTINVAGQTYFSKDCPNIYARWTWMVLMKVTMAKLFPQYDRILSLDVDTIVLRNIDELWELDLDDYYIAAASEPEKNTDEILYINSGVVMHNLKKLRQDKIDDELIKKMNNKTYEFPQECFSEVCKGKILELPATYNSCKYTETIDNPKIRHFADDEKWRQKAVIYQHQNMNWGDARRS